jgi:ribonuclease P protein component
MLPKSSRLSRAEFPTVFSRPDKRQHFSEYSMYYSPAATFKASVVVGKKVAKLAVNRNRLRREVYTGLQHSLLSQSNLTGSYIFIFKPSFAKMTKAERQAVIAQLLAQKSKAR